MGEILEELYDHEGYALRRLPDGTLTSIWTYATQAFTAFVAGCDCGWRGRDAYAPSLAGEQAALTEWYGHAQDELDRQADRRRQELGQTLRALGRAAEFLDNPATLERVARAAERAAEQARQLAE